MISIERPAMFEVVPTGKPTHPFVESAQGWTKERIELLTLAKSARRLLVDAMIQPEEVEVVKAYRDLVALGCLKERDKYEGGKLIGVEFAITAAGKRELKRVSAIIGEYA